MKRTLFRVGLLASAITVAASSYADDKAACLDAASKGQNLRDAHKLVEARDQFRVCARQECPSIVQQDCGRWLGEIEGDVSTVVVTAKDGAGTDLVDVRVSLDGQPFVTTLDGQAVAIDPGSHVLHFELADGTQLDRPVLIKEGEKNQGIAVVLSKAVTAPAVVSPAEPHPSEGSNSQVTEGAPEHRGTAPWKTVGWVLGGAGVVGLGIGAIFGAMAISDKSSANCNAQNQCQSGPLSSARSAANGADVGLIAGGVLLATGAALVLFAPRSHEASTARVEMAPSVGPGQGGVVVGGSW